jgi:HD-GYP domain-containing protein (c-di-GMP phosphodiesterase class II)
LISPLSLSNAGADKSDKYEAHLTALQLDRHFLLEEGLEVVNSLAAALNAKDDYSGKHSETVQKLSVQIGERLEISKDRIHLLRMGALAHDIGKLAVPDAILNKPARLTRSEWAIIRQHPRMGVIILTETRWLGPLLPLVLYHHERYDGKGYPMGKAGRAIPLLARIIGVADAYAAMTSLRSYRKQLRPEAAWEEIESAKGSHFDPAVVEALAMVLKMERCI